MKKEKYFLFLSALLLCLAFWPRMVFADTTVYDPDRKGSVTVQLDHLGTDREGITLYCYPVGVPKIENGNLTGWEADSRYSSLKLNLNDLEATQKHRNAVKSLVDFIEKQDILPLLRSVTDKDGVCTFENLEQGMYLICQKDGFSQYGTVQDFLVPVPFMESGLFLYDVKTETKGTLPGSPEPSPVPEPSESPSDPIITPVPNDHGTDTPGTVRTGDSAPVGILLTAAVIALICAGCVIFIRWKRNKK